MTRWLFIVYDAAQDRSGGTTVTNSEVTILLFLAAVFLAALALQTWLRGGRDE